MEEKLRYYFECYLHQDWNHECGSSDIRDSLAFFFKNECGGNAEAHLQLVGELIRDIDEYLALDDEQVMSRTALANYWLPTVSEARAWLRQLRDWCLAHQANIRDAAP